MVIPHHALISDLYWSSIYEVVLVQQVTALGRLMYYAWAGFYMIVIQRCLNGWNYRKIDVTDIYEQEINFLVGSGASSGIFPTLATAMKNETTGCETVETLAQYFEEENKQELKTLLFMYYYKECIEPVMSFNWESEKVSDKLIDGKKTKVIDNYKAFISTLYGILELRKAHEKVLISLLPIMIPAL